jgi:Zn-dependent peptidase ImmA (M78 family)
VVGNNTHRPLDPCEFQGFALVDDLAPVVFINGADFKAAQMFTLAHELAHLWLGQSAVSDAGAAFVPTHEKERWCNQVAAELLVPLDVVSKEFKSSEALHTEVKRLKKQFKVSGLVVLRRLFDAQQLTESAFHDAYSRELASFRKSPKGAGGSFYLTQAVRVSKRFARAVIESTFEGRTLFRDAFDMLGTPKDKTFREFVRNLESGAA